MSVLIISSCYLTGFSKSEYFSFRHLCLWRHRNERRCDFGRLPLLDAVSLFVVRRRQFWPFGKAISATGSRAYREGPQQKTGEVEPLVSCNVCFVPEPGMSQTTSNNAIVGPIRSYRVEKPLHGPLLMQDRLNFFEPWERIPANHENQLKRAHFCKQGY
jgi:hypothetical protein